MRVVIVLLVILRGILYDAHRRGKGMSLNDEDLKRLKFLADVAGDEINVQIGKGILGTLLSRLAAAEKFIGHGVICHQGECAVVESDGAKECDCGSDAAYNAWLASKGSKGGAGE